MVDCSPAARLSQALHAFIASSSLLHNRNRFLRSQDLYLDSSAVAATIYLIQILSAQPVRVSQRWCLAVVGRTTGESHAPDPRVNPRFQHTWVIAVLDCASVLPRAFTTSSTLSRPSGLPTPPTCRVPCSLALLSRRMKSTGSNL